MARMNSKTRKRLYEILRGRDGEYCAGCGRVGSWESLCIDHEDNNNRNNALDNLQFLCRSCNTKKNPRGKGKSEGKPPIIESIPSSKELMLKEKYEPMFRKWLEEKVIRDGSIAVQEAIDAGAEITGAATITIEKYLRKMCSTAGRFHVVIVNEIKYVEFKEWFQPN